MKKFLFASVAAAALISGSAFAADLPSRSSAPAFAAPAPIAYNWTGFYVGAQIGGGWTTASPTTYTGLGFTGVSATPAGISPSGILGGVHAGFNYQINQFVVGLEGDAEASGVSGTTAYGAIGSVRIKDTFRGSIRGRLGFAIDRALIYGTGGVAFQNFSKLDFGATSASYSSTRTGWTLGGGIEFAINNQWSVNAEYRYADFGKWGANRLGTDPFIGGSLSEKTRLTDNSVRVGISYHFNTQPSAVVAKY